MRLRHPYSLNDDAPDPDGRVHWGGRRDWAEVDDDGTFEVPDDRAEQFVHNWPTAEGYSVDDLAVSAAEQASDDDADTCEAVKTDGEVCGRELPCPYHSED